MSLHLPQEAADGFPFPQVSTRSNAGLRTGVPTEIVTGWGRSLQDWQSGTSVQASVAWKQRCKSSLWCPFEAKPKEVPSSSPCPLGIAKGLRETSPENRIAEMCRERFWRSVIDCGTQTCHQEIRAEMGLLLGSFTSVCFGLPGSPYWVSL